MGGVVSSGETNNELIDNLCKERYIVTPEIEKVFRMIDRKDYMTFDEDDTNHLEAYEDHAWRRGNLHLSAPCIYTKALEALHPKHGHSFLNIGSGTGYFSTMVGLLLGPTGQNHGIELHQDNVEFAYERLNSFKESSPWYDPVEFCEPLFVVGNALLLSPSGILYDRIYCGAACPAEHLQLLKNVLKVGGILVTPCDSCLEAITRINDQEWSTETILSTVSFAPLILPSTSTDDLTAIILTSEVRSLRELSRLAILSALGRDRYQYVTSLPLPTHLLEYVSLNRTWGPPPSALNILCPMEEDDEQTTGDHDNTVTHVFKEQGLSIREIAPGRQVLLVNINGLLMQLPVENDSESEHEDEREQNEPGDNNE